MIEENVLTDATDDRPQTSQAVETAPKRSGPAQLTVSLASFGFALLQSACVAVMTLSGLRLLIGVGSLAAASSTLRFLDSVHSAAFRLPMMAIAVAGSLVNLYVLWRVRSLRARPASAWRVKPATPQQMRLEKLQILFALATLALVAAELVGHAHQFGNSFS